MSQEVKIYCQSCEKSQPMEIEPIGPDVLNGTKNWGDLCCSKCHFVIATLEADEPGVYEFVKVNEKGEMKDEINRRYRK